MKKRGQVTLFIIIAIFIVVVVLLLIQFKPWKTINLSSNQNTQSDLAVIKKQIETKLYETTIDSLYIVSLRGGYYNMTNPVLEYQNYLFKLYNSTNFPSKETVANDMSKYIENNLKNKLNLSQFESEGYSFDMSDLKANVVLGNTITANVTFPITIKKGDQVVQLKDFSTSLNFNFSYLYPIIQQTYNDVQGGIDLTKNYSYKGVDVKIDTLNINDYVVVIAMNNSLTNMSLYWIYAVTHNWNELFDFPKLYAIPDFNITNASEFKYQVQAVGENLTYSDNTNLFDINQTTGLIDFNATKEMNGNYSILIEVIDPKDREDNKFMNLNINIK